MKKTAILYPGKISEPLSRSGWFAGRRFLFELRNLVRFNPMKKLPLRRLSLAAAIVLNAFTAEFASAANQTWNGGGSPTNLNWNVPVNWGGTAPVANDLLFFDGAAGVINTNDFAADTQFNALTFNGGASAFTLFGNTVTLGGGITNNSSNVQTVLSGLKVGASRTINGGTSVGAGIILGMGLTNIATTGVITITLAGNGTITNLLERPSTTGTNIFATTASANWDAHEQPRRDSRDASCREFHRCGRRVQLRRRKQRAELDLHRGKRNGQRNFCRFIQHGEWAADDRRASEHNRHRQYQRFCRDDEYRQSDSKCERRGRRRLRHHDHRGDCQ